MRCGLHRDISGVMRNGSLKRKQEIKLEMRS